MSGIIYTNLNVFSGKILSKFKQLNILISVTIFILIIAATAESQPKESGKSISSKIKSILANPMMKHTVFGMRVTDLTAKKTVYDEYSDRLLRPASVLKLFTTASAYELLDTNFLFKTELILNPGDIIVNDSILCGNLYFKGYGDPLLNTNDLAILARSLTISGIKTIDGNIIGDSYYFDNIFWGKGWMWDDEPEVFAAFISPLSINGNSISIKVAPSNSINEPPVVYAEDLVPSIEINNDALTVSNFQNGEPNNFNNLRVTRKSRKNVIDISGNIHINDSGKEFKLSLWEPEKYLLSLFRQHLNKTGIRVSGELIVDTTSKGHVVSAIFRNLDTIIVEINKNSNNLAAENLLKTISREISGTRGSTVEGIKFLKSFLYRTGIDTSLILIADGSGASRYSLISAKNTTDLLGYIYQKKYFKRFKNSLAIAGIDGTLNNRFTNSKLKNNLYGKTGTHSDVSSLAGFITTKNGSVLSFCIIINNYIGKTRDYRQIIDQICTVLADY